MERITVNVFIDKAIELYQAREIQRSNGKVRKKDLLNKQRLGLIIYPDSQDEAVRVSMNNMSKGAMKKVSVSWVSLISKELGVDANFLFGQPSKFDEEYKNLVNGKKLKLIDNN